MGATYGQDPGDVSPPSLCGAEMPKSCSAYNCTNRYSSKNPDITFHRFPFSKPSVLKQWLDNIGRDNFQPRKHMVICSLHFTPDCFSSAGNRKNLLWNAVPTLFTIPSQHAKQRHSRKRLKETEPALPVWDSISNPALTETQDKYLQTSSETSPDISHDHTYTLLDPCSAKTHLFNTIENNKRLQRRLWKKCQEIKRIKQRLQAAQGELMALRSSCGFSLRK